MREVRFRWIDGAAVLGWVVGVALAADITGGASDKLRPWLMIAVVLAALASVIAWLSRRLDGLENHVYTEGMRAGLEAKQVMRLPEQRSPR